MNYNIERHKELYEKVISILRKHGIKKILVFGSYARGEATPKSDLDLIVEFPKGTSLLDHIGIENDLIEKLKIKVDLISKNGISPYLKDDIMKEAIVIFE